MYSCALVVCAESSPTLGDGGATIDLIFISDNEYYRKFYVERLMIVTIPVLLETRYHRHIADF